MGLVFRYFDVNSYYTLEFTKIGVRIRKIHKNSASIIIESDEWRTLLNHWYSVRVDIRHESIIIWAS